MVKYPNLPKYPKLEYYSNLRDDDKVKFINKEVYWTEKEDGSNVGLFLDVETKKLRVRSRNQSIAMFEPSVLAIPESENVHSYLLEHPQLIFYGEFLKKGCSPTRLHVHPKDDLVFFDIFDMSTGRFLTVDDSHDIFEGIGVRSCNIDRVAIYDSYGDLMQDVYGMIAKAEGLKIEGYVYKINDPDIFLKCKPTYEIIKAERTDSGTTPRHPQIPDGDVYAILQQLKDESAEEDFYNQRIAMPLFAKKIAVACREDMFSPPAKKLFTYYQDYVNGLWW